MKDFEEIIFILVCYLVNSNQVSTLGAKSTIYSDECFESRKAYLFCMFCRGLFSNRF